MCAHGFHIHGSSQLQMKCGQAYEAGSVLSVCGHCFSWLFSAHHSVATIYLYINTVSEVQEGWLEVTCKYNYMQMPVCVTDLSIPRGP